MAYDNNLSGALFKNNEKREGKQDADYRGQAEINREKFWVNAWIKTSKAGDKYMSLSFQPQQAQRTQKGAPADVPRDAMPDFNDDIPF